MRVSSAYWKTARISRTTIRMPNDSTDSTIDLSDFAIDTPARIAILGAGPIGLEAALYARFLGYEVIVYERGVVGENVLQWGHVRMFTPFSLSSSSLGLAALKAQDEGYRPPEPGAPLLGRDWVREYLLPLSQTDLIVDHVRQRVAVLSVSRQTLLKADPAGQPERAADPFRILLRAADGTERSDTAQVVIDTTGVYRRPNWLGPGGAPAIGETALRGRIEYWLPDIEGRERERYAARHTLLVGDGYSAATNAVALSGLALQAPGTRVTWVTPRPLQPSDSGPIRYVPHDPLRSRRDLVSAANRYARGEDSIIEHWPATRVEAVSYLAAEDQYLVRFSGQHAGEIRFDRVIGNVGYRGDDRLYAELQVQPGYLTGGLRDLAVALRDQTAAASGTVPSCQPATLLTPEPNFYILGAKSYGRDSSFVYTVGLEQIRGVFSIIAGRVDLDLYKTIKP